MSYHMGIEWACKERVGKGMEFGKALLSRGWMATTFTCLIRSLCIFFLLHCGGVCWCSTYILEVGTVYG